MLDHQDHRQIAQRLDLLHFQEEAPGMAFWHPNGFVIFRALEDAVRAVLSRDHYLEVRSPQVIRRAIWALSGHWSHFASGMFLISNDSDDGDVAQSVNAREAALKPVSCPGHVQIFKRASPSYRDLPMRLAELGVVHRNEASGTLQGLFRLRQFTQDDGHIFCAPSQAKAEIVQFCRSVIAFYRACGFPNAHVALSTRPIARVGDDAVWDQAEAMLAEAASDAGFDPVIQPGEGAFYGPKLEFALDDRLGRRWQCGTIQLDFVMPERFDIDYIDNQGQRQRPVMLHRAMCGSLERFMGILLEHYEGRLPLWLAPVQLVIAPIGEAQHAYAQSLFARAKSAGLRVLLDDRSESLSKRIAEAHMQGVRCLWVVGAREAQSQSVSIREHGISSASALMAQDALDTLCAASQRPDIQ